MPVRTAFDYNNRVIELNDRVKIRQGVYAGFTGKISRIEDGKVQIKVPSIGDSGIEANVSLHPRSVEVTDTQRSE